MKKSLKKHFYVVLVCISIAVYLVFFQESQHYVSHDRDADVVIRRVSARERSKNDEFGVSVIKKAMQEARLSSNPDMALDQIIKSLVKEIGGYEALAHFQKLPYGSERRLGIANALFEISRDNRKDALKIALELSPEDLHDLTIPNLFLPNNSSDFLTSLSLLETLADGDLRDRTLSVIVQSGEYISSKEFQDLLGSSGITDKEREILNVCFGKSLIRDDALFASQTISGLKDSQKLPLVFELMSSWPDEDIEGAVLWLYSNKIPSQMLSIALHPLLNREFNQNPNNAINILESMPPGKVSDSLYAQMANLLYDRNKEDSMKWIEGLPDGPARDIASESYFMRTFAKDPRQSLDDLNQNSEGLKNSLKIQEKLVASWAASDPEAAIDWVSKSIDQKNGGHGNLRQLVFDTWAATSPLQLIKQIEEKPDIVPVNSVAGRLIDSLAVRGSYSDAGDWMLRNNVGTPARAYSLTARWLRDDPVSASQWVSGLPRSQVYDAAASAIIAEVRKDNLNMAVEWAKTISDEKSRNEILKDLGK